MYVTFIIGTAGSGKSLLTAAFSEWLRSKEQNVCLVNLDPSVMSLPYEPDVDVRDYIIIEDLMEKYQLGPNGALIMAADLLAAEVDKIRTDIEYFRSDIVVIDTPGQMELFAFRSSGPYIAHNLTNDPRSIIYLFDATFSSNPLNFVSNLFLAAAAFNRFLLPQVHVLSKVDLLPSEQVDAILDWSEDEEYLQTAIETQLTAQKMLLSRGVFQAIRSVGLTFELIPVSAKTQSGLIDLYSALTRIFTGGEELI